MIPSKITAGDSISFSVGSYKDQQGRTIGPPAWTAKIALRGNATAELDLTADSSWLFVISKVQTAALPVGKCFFQLYAENGSDRVTMAQGQIEVLRNLATAAANVDNRSQTQIDLEQVQTLIRSLVSTGGVVEYSIGGRRARKYELTDLLALETQLKSRLAREQQSESINNGLGNPHKTLVRFK